MKWLCAIIFVVCIRVRESWPVDNIVDYVYGWVKDVKSRVCYPREHDIVELPDGPVEDKDV